jgi:hypothetical protein
MYSAAEKRFKRTASKPVRLNHKKQMRATLPVSFSMATLLIDGCEDSSDCKMALFYWCFVGWCGSYTSTLLDIEIILSIS